MTAACTNQAAAAASHAGTRKVRVSPGQQGLTSNHIAHRQMEKPEVTPQRLKKLIMRVIMQSLEKHDRVPVHRWKLDISWSAFRESNSFHGIIASKGECKSG
jgi:hypothetical protein